MARHGVGVLREEGEAPGRPAERRDGRRVEYEGGSRSDRRRPEPQDQWVPQGPVRPDRFTRQRPGQERARPAPAVAVKAPAVATKVSAAAGDELDVPGEVVDELARAVGRVRGEQLARRMAAAARAYERDRYGDAMRITRLLAQEIPESASVRELHGLACYRAGRWREAVRHLQEARALSGDDPSQIPVLMDCERAMGHRRRVETLWEELRASSPPADVLVEGRLVLAADLAGRGRLDEAVTLLVAAGAARNLRHPGERHLRQWYVLADLYERAGDVPRARELFGRVVAADPELADAAERLAALGRPRRAATRTGRSATARPGRSADTRR